MMKLMHVCMDYEVLKPRLPLNHIRKRVIWSTYANNRGLL